MIRIVGWVGVWAIDEIERVNGAAILRKTEVKNCIPQLERIRDRTSFSAH